MQLRSFNFIILTNNCHCILVISGTITLETMGGKCNWLAKGKGRANGIGLTLEKCVWE